MLKTVIMIRKKGNRIHKTTLTKDVFMHVDIVDMIHERMLRRGYIIDIDELIGCMQTYNSDKEVGMFINV